MKKHVILTLEYDMGDYSGSEKYYGKKLTAKIEDWDEEFFQSDATISDLRIVKVRIEKR